MSTLTKRVAAILLAAGLWGCAEKEEVAIESDSVETVGDALVETDSESAPTQRFYNEFLACTRGPDYSEENVDKMVAEFNTLALAGELVWAGGYAPVEGKNRNSNGWWENQWTSKEAAQAGWEAWQADEEAQNWNERFQSVVQCDETQIYAYMTYFPAPESMHLESWANFAAAEIECNFNEGKGKEDLDSNIEEFAVWLAENGTGEQFEYGIYMPVRPDDPADFYWFNWHANFESMERGNENWETNGLDLKAKFDNTATCVEPNLYSGREIYGLSIAE